MSNGRISFRLSAEEMLQFQTALDRLQGQYGKHVHVTQKQVFLEGLDALVWRDRLALPDLIMHPEESRDLGQGISLKSEPVSDEKVEALKSGMLRLAWEKDDNDDD